MPDATPNAVVGGLLHQVSVGQQGGEEVDRRLEHHRVDAEHIGPIEKISNSPKTLGLALCVEPRLTRIKAHELGIPIRIDECLDGEGAGLQLGAFEMVGAHVDVAGQQWLAIEPRGLEVEPVACEDEVLRLPAV